MPLEVWHYNSPELKRSGRVIDIGLVAEALIFYDRVYFAFTSDEQFVRVVAWFRGAGMLDSLVSLLDDGVLVPYFYAFATSPADVRGVWSIWNLQDEVAAKEAVFAPRILESARLQGLVKQSSARDALARAAMKHVIEVMADAFGPAIENARADYGTEERGAFLMQIVVDELYRDLGFLRPPVITATVIERGGLKNITWNQNFEKLFRKLGPNLAFHNGIPLAGAANCSRTLWSAATLGVDLYVGTPLSEYVRAKLDEGNSAAKAHLIVNELVDRAEFPDIRAHVLAGRIGPREVLDLRRRSERFRAWLASEKDLDRDAVLAYLGELASEAGWKKDLGKIIGALGLIGGASLGAVASGPFGVIGGAVAGAGAQFVFDVGQRMLDGWKPVVFGNVARARIAAAQAKKD